MIILIHFLLPNGRKNSYLIVKSHLYERNIHVAYIWKYRPVSWLCSLHMIIKKKHIALMELSAERLVKSDA